VIAIKQFCLVAGSPAITLAQLSEVGAALQIQLARDVCPIWGLVAPSVTAVSEPGAAPPGSTQLRLARASDVSGAAGYHTTDQNGMPIGYIFTDGMSLDDITSTVSHEAAEALKDPGVNNWWWSEAKKMHVADELSDPCEGRIYRINNVAMSDFVTPDYFNDASPVGHPVDFMKVLTSPWSVDTAMGGYMMVMINGQTSQIPAERTRPGGACPKCAKHGFDRCHPTARHVQRLLTPPRPPRLPLSAHPLHAAA